MMARPLLFTVAEPISVKGVVMVFAVVVALVAVVVAWLLWARYRPLVLRSAFWSDGHVP